MNRNSAPALEAPPPVKRRDAVGTPAVPTGAGQSKYVPWLYILPVLILVVGIVYVGIGYTGWVSTLDWNGIDPVAEPAGLANYTQITTDPAFWQTITHFAVFALLTITAQMALGLFMAVLLSGSVVFARTLYKIVLFLPVILAPAVIATAFRSLLSPQGSLNAFLTGIGLPASDIAWLADPHLALFTLAAMNIWQWTGLSFLLYQAAIAQLDQDLFEAAALDGASWWQTFSLVLLPQLRGTHAILALTGCIGALKTFDIVYLTTGGGPGRSTEFLTTYIYEQVIEQFHAGYSAALSIVLVILALLLSTVQIRAYRFGEE
ncbi:carbohydrate ABC transporter permease [Streptomyces violaceusniger]|uniref:carbohydrate ABC transporter permease n=1 Tax=Streptomyces violaceusniger TaxID=68280 RepID=UPI0009C2635C|nr:sugar ABC transporter permease [Streptomyces hygroscopicus]AQW56383.1 ABC transporter, permease protein [Streptomyces hygroscopicus]